MSVIWIWWWNLPNLCTIRTYWFSALQSLWDEYSRSTIFYSTLKESVTLFKLYCKDELAPTVEYGLIKFKRLCIFSKNECPKFDPQGWMSDESGAILAALERVYGEQIHTKMATCQYHFTMSVNKIKKNLTLNSGQLRFADIPWKPLLLQMSILVPNVTWSHLWSVLKMNHMSRV